MKTVTSRNIRAGRNSRDQDTSFPCFMDVNTDPKLRWFAKITEVAKEKAVKKGELRVLEKKIDIIKRDEKYHFSGSKR